jgi:hypothetical protein
VTITSESMYLVYLLSFAVIMFASGLIAGWRILGATRRDPKIVRTGSGGVPPVPFDVDAALAANPATCRYEPRPSGWAVKQLKLRAENEGLRAALEACCRDGADATITKLSALLTALRARYEALSRQFREQVKETGLLMAQVDVARMHFDKALQKLQVTGMHPEIVLAMRKAFEDDLERAMAVKGAPRE